MSLDLYGSEGTMRQMNNADILEIEARVEGLTIVEIVHRLGLLRPRVEAAMGADGVDASPSDRVFLTARGTPQTRENARRRALKPAILRANEKLCELRIDPIGP